jgi:hypothetical protein
MISIVSGAVKRVNSGANGANAYNPNKANSHAVRTQGKGVAKPKQKESSGSSMTGTSDEKSSGLKPANGLMKSGGPGPKPKFSIKELLQRKAAKANPPKIPNYITHNATQKKIIYIFNFNRGMQGLFTSKGVSKAGNGQEISQQTDADQKNLPNHNSYVSKPDVAGRYRPPTHGAGLVKNFKENIGKPNGGYIY